MKILALQNLKPLAAAVAAVGGIAAVSWTVWTFLAVLALITAYLVGKWLDSRKFLSAIDKINSQPGAAEVHLKCGDSELSKSNSAELQPPIVDEEVKPLDPSPSPPADTPKPTKKRNR